MLLPNHTYISICDDWQIDFAGKIQWEMLFIMAPILNVVPFCGANSEHIRVTNPEV